MVARDKKRSLEATTALQRFGVEGEDAAAFLQRRVANAALFATSIIAGFSVFRITMAVVLDDANHLMSPSLHLFVAATLPAAAQWLLCRRGKRTMRATTLIELTCTTLTCWLIVGSGADTPLLMMPALVTAFAVGTMLTLRAIYVPSPPRRTLMLALVTGVPYMVMSIYVARVKWTPEAVALAEAT